MSLSNGPQAESVVNKTAAATVVVLLLTAGVLFLWVGAPGVAPPDPESAEPVDVHQYLASETFGGLSPDRKADYLEQLWQQPGERLAVLMKIDEVPENVRRRMANNARQGFVRLMVRYAAECEALPEEARDAYVDRKLDDMVGKMQTVREKMPAGGPHGHMRDPDEMQKMIQRMLSDTTPEERSLLRRYRERMVSRIVRREMRQLMQRMGLRR